MARSATAHCFGTRCGQRVTMRTPGRPSRLTMFVRLFLMNATPPMIPPPQSRSLTRSSISQSRSVSPAAIAGDAEHQFQEQPSYDAPVLRRLLLTLCLLLALASGVLWVG